MSVAKTASASETKGFDLKRSLLETLVAGLLALIVFGPVVGVVLDGYTFNAEPRRVAWLVGGVMVGRFLLSLYLQTAAGVRMLQGFDNGGSGVHVNAPDYKSRLRYIIPALVVIAIVIFMSVWFSRFFKRHMDEDAAAAARAEQQAGKSDH